jgi:hypothetical protein
MRAAGLRVWRANEGSAEAMTMRTRRRAVSVSSIVAVTLLCGSLSAQAQSPYGLAARQTIPFVLDQNDDGRHLGQTEVSVFNPNPTPIGLTITYFGALGTASPGKRTCLGPVGIPAGANFEFEVGPFCSLNPGMNFGRLELSTLAGGNGPVPDPSSVVFLANARVGLPGRYFAVEGFPQGNLSGNKGFAVVTGLKNGSFNGSLWRTDCYAAALNEPTPVFVRVADTGGTILGGFVSAAFPTGEEVQAFPDVFTAVGAPPNNYSGAVALFSTAAQGGIGGAGVFGFCRIVNLTLNQEAFEVAKYVDNNDEGRQHHTLVNETSWGGPFAQFSIPSEFQHDGNRLFSNSDLHVAYFQHPDRIVCSVRFTPNPDAPFSDLGQVRLIDPDGFVAAGGPHAQSFTLNLGEKSQRHNGRNGRWLIEVGPDRTVKAGGNGGPIFTDYSLSCSSGNGHTQLDVAGHCLMECQKAGNQALCGFDQPFAANRCSVYGPWTFE